MLVYHLTLVNATPNEAVYVQAVRVEAEVCCAGKADFRCGCANLGFGEVEQYTAIFLLGATGRFGERLKSIRRGLDLIACVHVG
jgi:hypothetical protein